MPIPDGFRLAEAGPEAAEEIAAAERAIFILHPRWQHSGSQ